MERNVRLAVIVLLATLAVAAVAIVGAQRAAAGDYDIKLTFRDETNVRVAQGLNPISFNYTIKSMGTYMSTEVMIELQNEPLYWQHYLSASTKAGVRTSTNVLEILMQKGETSNVSLTITPPQNQLNQTFWMTFNAYPKKAVTDNRSHNIGIIIPQAAGFEIRIWNEPTEGYFAAIPPSQITLRFAMFNTGNGLDRFLIQYESSRNDAGWVLRPVSGIDIYGFTPNMSADPEKKHPLFIDFQIPIPAEEKADMSCQVVVNATSMYNQTKQMPPAFTSIKALQYYDFQVYINGFDRKVGTPGEQVEFQLRIWNRGNGWDTFTIVPVWDEQLNPGFIASANPRTINIASNDTQQVSYIVKVPETAPKKIYFFSTEVSSSSKELAIVTKSFEVEVGQFYKIVLSSPDANMSTIPGGILDYEVDVRNAGNGLDSMTISLMGVPAGWLTYIQPPEVSLLQNEQAKVSIRVIVPSRFEEAPIGSYKITLKADSSRSDAEAVFDLQLDITQFFRVEWMYQDQPITDPLAPIAQPGIIKPRRSFNPFERNYVDITLEIKNFGNGDDNIEVWGKGVNPQVLVNASPVQTLLLRDQTKLIKVHIEVPRDLPPGVYSLFVNATSQDKITPTRVVPLDFEIYNYDAKVPSIPTYIDPVTGDSVRAEISVQEGTNLTFKLRVDNAGTKPMQAVLVRVYDTYMENGQIVTWNFFNLTTPPIAVGDKYVVGERPFTVTNPPLYWWANVTGPHTMQFKLFYDFQAVSTNDVASVNITVKEITKSIDIFHQTSFIMAIVLAVVVAVAIVGGYVFVLRRKPIVDKDLYSSIYGADFEESAPMMEAEAPAAAAATAMTPEQQALYGGDYGTEGGGDEEGYDDEGEEGYEDEPQQ
jgi:uncharacterized membrane protein